MLSPISERQKELFFLGWIRRSALDIHATVGTWQVSSRSISTPICRNRLSRRMSGGGSRIHYDLCCMSKVNHSNGGRLGVGNRVTLTRGQVAKRFGKDVSWVRRREGSLFHPVKEDGVHRFDEREVESLEEALAAELSVSDASERAVSRVSAILANQLGRGSRMSFESVAEHVDISADAVKRIYKQWSAKCRAEGEAVPPLLSRAQLIESEQREVAAINRDYDKRMAQAVADEDAWLRQTREKQRQQRAKQERDARAYEAERSKWLARQLALISGSG